MKIHKGNKVKVIAGKDKGKVGTVIKAFPKLSMVLVEGVNLVKKHVKPGSVSKEGGLVKFEKPVHVSNVKLEKETAPVKEKAEKKTKDKKEVENK